MITTNPTRIIMDLTGIRRAKRAAMGADTTPPKINPAITCQYPKPIMVKKVMEDAKETKNSVKFTEPIVYMGCLPLAIKVEDTMGPHPPPPIASKYPPTKANKPILLVGFLTIRFVKAFLMIITPRNKV